MNDFVILCSRVSRDNSSRRIADVSGSVSFLRLALIALVIFWFIGFFSLTWNLHLGDVAIPSVSVSQLFHDNRSNRILNISGSRTQKQERPLLPHNLSRIPGKVTATADVRGNLGPASVVIQPVPGSHWLHDRWQAASNMHGQNIPGEHWILLEFHSPILVDSIRLDWETAYASDYRIEGSLERITDATSSDQVWTLFDSSNRADQAKRTEETTGQSPGVKQKMPLHVIHTIQSVSHNNNQQPVRFLRLHILKSATGWGVSLWQFDVIGYWEDQVVL
ncbi:carbohydrate binding protein [Nitzschia inconspicua]|uniref:Carbohydrate binding protein n=1 Tax=Nitzschia inconspicua TaxID=303405 RepID=A0A9K3LHA1_9STRA|nr:carbohydrate binding protein [Nitzschia inconspicua]